MPPSRTGGKDKGVYIHEGPTTESHYLSVTTASRVISIPTDLQYAEERRGRTMDAVNVCVNNLHPVLLCVLFDCSKVFHGKGNYRQYRDACGS